MSDLAALMNRAIAAHEASRLEEADTLYRAVLARQPHNLFAAHNLGMVLLGRGALAEAMGLLAPALAADPSNPDLANSHREAGLALFNAGYWEDALPWLERALRAFPDDGALRQAEARARPRTYLAPEIADGPGGRILRRGAPREAGTYVYAIDVVGTCNLRCPSCPQGNSRHSERPRGFMEPGRFEQILDRILTEAVTPNPEVWLYSWGEPLLHPRLPALIEAINVRGLTAHLSSNLNIKRGIEEAIRARPATLKISMSGLTQATYGRGHAGGQVQLLIENMHRIRRALDETGAPTRVWVGHHLYKHNLHEREQARALCAELGFGYQPIAAFYQPLERLLAIAEGESLSDPILDDLLEHPKTYIARFRTERRRDYDCELRFNQTAINYDGTVALCCSVYDAANMLGVRFLDSSQAQIDQLKYDHPFCGSCMEHGLNYSPAHLLP